MSGVNIRSDIGRLKKVLVHKPGGELLNLVPDYLEYQLFDDIPWLKVAVEEHNAFVKLMRDLGVEVYYITDLLAEVCADSDAKAELIERFVAEANIYSDGRMEAVKEFLDELPVSKMVDVMISGIHKSEITSWHKHLCDVVVNGYPFLVDPMPNMYFTRDPFSCVGNGVIMSSMYMQARRRETLFGDFVFERHPLLAGTTRYYDRNARYSVEGGDVMVLDDQTLAIGASQRTNVNAIEDIAKNILKSDSGFKRILAIDVPKMRTYMHLDTVFSMVDKGTFAIHPNIESQLKVYLIEVNDNNRLSFTEESNLVDALRKHLQLDKVNMIRCGGMNYVNSAREQWNDGANTLAVAPGEIIVYARNQYTNRLFEDNGIKIHEIPCSELSRGRGGPHCMTMPIERE
ncbi:MAG: arginine deiminase [Clostridia bacterium]|nr:arginine deiminase [Clostridia bacterium]